MNALYGFEGYAPATRRVKSLLGGSFECGKASDFIRCIFELAQRHPGLAVVFYIRVSSYPQAWNENHRAQLRYLRAVARRIGLKPIGVIYEVDSGWTRGRQRFAEAVRLAERQHAVILAESTCRFIRSLFYRTTNPGILPTTGEFQMLAAEARGALLATCLHPDEDWKSVRAHETKRGKGIVSEPGELLRQRQNNLRRVLKLRYMDYSILEIVRMTGLARSTIRDWIRKSAIIR